MSYQLDAPTDRWNVNLPAVVGVVLVLLAGVVVWVVTSAGSDGDPVAAPTSTLPAPTVTGAPVTVAPGTTTPAPMPDLDAATAATAGSTAPSSAPTSAPTTAPPVTAAPSAGPDAVPGDLGIPGRAMLAPPCNDSYITVLASAIGADASAPAVAAVLDEFPTASYLRTDQTCPSLTPDIDGEPVYVVFFGPFPFASDACAARADGTPDAYARRLSVDLGPGHSVDCDG